MRTWLVWDGRRWSADDTAAVERFAKETVRSIYAEAEHERDEKRRTKLGAHAVGSERASKIEAMITLARSDERIVVQPRELDADPYLLNVLNGTIDLRTGALRPHRRADLLTRLAPSEFDPGARSERWETFLFESTGADPGLLTFLQRVAGYSITGTTSEEVLVMIIGPTASGKTTFVESFKAALGDYAATADFETFLAKREGGIRNDIARLVGKRIVVGVEVDHGRRLAEALIKLMTGGDTVTARELYRDFFEFRPTAKLWLVANDRPRVGDDDAMWRRIRVVPFDHPVPKERRDPQLKLALREQEPERAAVLAWAVAGCLRWQDEGLGTAPVIERATSAYREDMDPLAPFLEERCALEPDASATVSELYAAYRSFALAQGDRPITLNDLARRLSGQGIHGTKGARGVRLRRGIRLLDQQLLHANDGRSEHEVPAW